MSGKPASVAASRAGAPRVLVYVAEARQLEAGAAGPEPPAAAPAPAAAPQPPDTLYLHDNSHHHLPIPRNNIYRTQIDHSDHRNPPNTIFYKSLNDNDSKLSGYGTDNAVQRTEFFPVSQHYMKEPCLKVDDSKVPERLSNVKRECANPLGSEFSGIESFRIPVEAGEVATYQTRCPAPVSDNIMPSMQPVALRQNQYDSCTVQNGDGTNCSERELVGKSYVNYQFLEQSVSHQSIVNQSISILNQQVGVGRGEAENGPQLVRTADGVVLAVLPSSVLPHSESEAGSRTRCDSPQTITVPLGWRRIVNGTSVIYVRYVFVQPILNLTL